MAAERRRIEFLDHVAAPQLGAVISAHDVVVLPSLWECWPYVALEAMRRNRPVLATPTGGFTELIRPGVNGWLTARHDRRGADRALERSSSRTATAARAAATRRPARRPSPRSPIRARSADRYARCSPERRRRTRADRRVRRAARLGHRPVLPDGRVRRGHDALGRRADLPAIEIDRRQRRLLRARGLDPRANSPRATRRGPHAGQRGLGAARNFGITQARGRYVLPLDADNMIEPTFVERCVEVLEADPASRTSPPGRATSTRTVSRSRTRRSATSRSATRATLIDARQRRRRRRGGASAAASSTSASATART